MGDHIKTPGTGLALDKAKFNLQRFAFVQVTFKAPVFVWLLKLSNIKTDQFQDR